MAVYSPGQVRFSGDARTLYPSSPSANRAFCAKCGTSLTYETDLPGYGPVCALHISAFDDPEALRPTHHSFYAERISRFDIADDLPRHAGFVSDGALIGHGPQDDKSD